MLCSPRFRTTKRRVAPLQQKNKGHRRKYNCGSYSLVFEQIYFSFLNYALGVLLLPLLYCWCCAATAVAVLSATVTNAPDCVGLSIYNAE